MRVGLRDAGAVVVALFMAALLAWAVGIVGGFSAASQTASDATTACASFDPRTSATTVGVVPAGGRLVGAFSLTAGEVAAQDETPRGGPSGPHSVRSRYRDFASDAPVVLCYFDGPITAPGGGPPEPPATFRPYDRYVVAIDPDGRAYAVVAGHRDSLEVAPRYP